MRKTYGDFELSEGKMEDEIDAVIRGPPQLPDHTHAPGRRWWHENGEALFYYCQSPWPICWLWRLVKEGFAKERKIWSLNGKFRFTPFLRLIANSFWSSQGIIGKSTSRRRLGPPKKLRAMMVQNHSEVIRFQRPWIGICWAGNFCRAVYRQTCNHPAPDWRQLVAYGCGTFLVDMGVHIFDTPYNALAPWLCLERSSMNAGSQMDLDFL